MLLFVFTKQECIPVGCLPPACCPYLPACTAPEGGTCPRGYLQGLYLPGGVPAQGGCTILGRCVPAWGEVYLPRSVYLPKGVYLPMGGLPAGGSGVPASGRAVYLPGGCVPTSGGAPAQVPPCEQNE